METYESIIFSDIQDKEKTGPPRSISKYIFESLSSAIDVSQDTILRFTTFLEDWKRGQFLFTDDTILQWKKGDTYCWDNQVLHGSANVGLHPKICLTITGPYK